MNYLITAAGRGTRFLQEGIKTPKPLIKIFGNELLIWSLNSFNFNHKDKLFIVTLKKHKVKESLKKKLNNIYTHIKILWLELDKVQNGQLLTSLKAIEYFKIEGSLIIHNCDSYFRFNADQLTNLSKENLFGIIPCFNAEGDHWSFAKPKIENKSLIAEIKEKERISNNCSIGTYIFSSSQELLKLSKNYLKENNLNKKSNEYFIAPIYQYAIDQGSNVNLTKAKYVKVFGTPKELLNSFNITFNELLGENSWNGHQIQTLVVDIDNTICKKEDDEDYSKAVPINPVCDAIKKAHKDGIYIILFTSRNMRTFKGSMGLINKITAPILIKWLADHKIPYDEIYFGKPWGNSVSYVDDKFLSIEQFIKS